MSDLSEISIGGIWVNAEGSHLDLIDNRGMLMGFYRTAVGAADTSNDYPLVGWRNGRALAFTVSWAPDAGSLTAWTGLLHKTDAVEIHAIWTLVRPTTIKKTADGFSEIPSDPWQAFLVQSAIFRQITDNNR